MKNKVFALLLMASVGGFKANDDAAQLAVTLAQLGTETYMANQKHQASLPSRKNLLRQLFWMFEHNPAFYKLDDFRKNFDYYIASLTDHIKVLENKIALKENGLKSSGMFTGLTASGLSALCAYASYFFFNERKNLLVNPGKAIFIVGSNPSLDLMFAVVGFGLTSALFAAAAGKKFYKVSCYAERLVERLERDKKFLAILEEEKALLVSKKVDNTTETAISNLLNSIVGAINSVVKNASSADAAV